MTVRHMRLALGLFFLCAGIGLLGSLLFAPDVVRKHFNLLRFCLGTVFALAMSGVNLAKWYAGRMAYEELTTPVRRPLQPDPTADTDAEPNPAFDFTKPHPEQTDTPANT